MARRSVTVEVSHYLSAPRLAPYLAETRGDIDLTLALYHWNFQLTAAFQEVLGVVEVVVRNAIDQQLRAWNPTRKRPSGVPYPADWTADPASPLAGLLRGPLREAEQRANRARAAREPHHSRKTAPICHDDVLAQLPFSTWKKLVPESAATTGGVRQLWNRAVVDAFPYGVAGNSTTSIVATRAETVIHDRMDRLHKLRNRVAHMENLLQVNVPARLSDCYGLLAGVSPQTRDWCAGLSRVSTVNDARPRP